MLQKRSEKVPAEIMPTWASIVALTDSFCKQHLNDEYSVLCRQLAAALARKRPSPLASGKVEVWACAIVHALGTVNFLWDKSTQPYMSAEQVCAAFGVKKSTASNKARQIRDLFGMVQFDPNWCLPSLVEDNPMIWMLSIDGLIQDVRTQPREVQEEAYRKGLIPYVPADRMTISIRDLPPFHVAAIDHPIEQAQRDLQGTMARLGKRVDAWAKKHVPSGPEATKLVSTRVMGDLVVAYTYCMAVPDSIVSGSEGVEIRDLPGGQYAVIESTSHRDAISRALDYWQDHYVPEHNLTVDSTRPTYQILRLGAFILHVPIREAQD